MDEHEEGLSKLRQAYAKMVQEALEAARGWRAQCTLTSEEMTRAEKAEAQLAVQLAANEELRRERDTAQHQFLAELKTNEELRVRMAELVQDKLGAYAATDHWVAWCEELQADRGDLRARLEGLVEGWDGIAKWIGVCEEHAVGKGYTNITLASGQRDRFDAALAAARAEGKAEPEQAEPLRAEELQAEADCAIQREAELGDMGLWPAGKAPPVIFEAAEIETVRLRDDKARLFDRLYALRGELGAMRAHLHRAWAKASDGDWEGVKICIGQGLGMSEPDPLTREEAERRVRLEAALRYIHTVSSAAVRELGPLPAQPEAQGEGP